MSQLKKRSHADSITAYAMNVNAIAACSCYVICACSCDQPYLPALSDTGNTYDTIYDNYRYAISNA